MGAAARALVLDLPAAIFDAIRALNDDGQRQAGDGSTLGVAQQ